MLIKKIGQIKELTGGLPDSIHVPVEIAMQPTWAINDPGNVLHALNLTTKELHV